MNSSNKVFTIDDLRKKILSYIINERCLSCHQPIYDNKNYITYKKYWSNEWRNTRCNKMIDYKVCNWCYYYVYEYP